VFLAALVFNCAMPLRLCDADPIFEVFVLLAFPLSALQRSLLMLPFLFLALSFSF